MFISRWKLLFFVRVVEQCRRAKGDMECSLYNAERRKKPVACTPKVCCASLHSCVRINTTTKILHIYIYIYLCIHICQLIPDLIIFRRTFALCRAICRLRACAHGAPCDRPRKSSSSTPTRPARLKCAVLGPGVEIPAPDVTLPASWTPTAMEMYAPPFCPTLPNETRHRGAMSVY